MTKVEIFEFKFGSVGWEERHSKINNFMKDKEVVTVLQDVIGNYMIITVVYHCR